MSSPPSSTGVAGLRHVMAPETKPALPTPQLPPGQNICADCERLIVGVFVRIKDKNLHVECFKCATCGSSLKNVGYYNINHKLYCDIHAKLAARSNPPAPNMVPVTIPPGGKVPVANISAALASHSLPSPSPLSPSANPLPPPFQPASQDSVDRCSFSNVATVKKEDAVTNLMFALTMATQKEFKENGTNTEPLFVSEKIIPINNYNEMSSNKTNDDQYPSVKGKYMPYKPKTGTSLSGPKPFSSVLPSTPTLAPVAAPLSNTLPRSASSTAMPEHANEDHISNNNTNGKATEHEILMSPISSEMYIPVGDYNSAPKFNSIDLRIPVHVVKGKTDSPDQEVFQINASRSIENSPIEFDGSLRSCVKTQLLENGTPYKINNGGVMNKNNDIKPASQNYTVVDGKNGSYGKSDVGNGVAERNGVNPPDLSSLGLADGQNPVCVYCNKEIKRGPFITALGKIWCPDHFVCTTPSCRRPLQDMGFVEERGQLYCEYCFEQYLAPNCSKCNVKIKGDCLNAIGKQFHPECFTCAYCSKLFGNSPFFLEDGLPYCETDWNELFTTKCFACGFQIDAGDRWVEALEKNYHSQCFNCTMCKKNLEGQSFFAKGGRPFCKNHAR